MEALILIPIGLIIYGWMQTVPAMTPPEGANGFDFPLNYCDVDDDFDFDSDCSPIFYCDAQGSVFLGVDDNDINTHTLNDNLMFDVAYSWCDFNIYHDHSDDFSSFSSFNDPFCTSIDDSFSTCSCIEF